MSPPSPPLEPPHDQPGIAGAHQDGAPRRRSRWRTFCWSLLLVIVIVLGGAWWALPHWLPPLAIEIAARQEARLQIVVDRPGWTHWRIPAFDLEFNIDGGMVSVNGRDIDLNYSIRELLRSGRLDQVAAAQVDVLHRRDPQASDVAATPSSALPTPAFLWREIPVTKTDIRQLSLRDQLAGPTPETHLRGTATMDPERVALQLAALSPAPLAPYRLSVAVDRQPSMTIELLARDVTDAPLSTGRARVVWRDAQDSPAIELDVSAALRADVLAELGNRYDLETEVATLDFTANGTLPWPPGSAISSPASESDARSPPGPRLLGITAPQDFAARGDLQWQGRWPVGDAAQAVSMRVDAAARLDGNRVIVAIAPGSEARWAPATPATIRTPTTGDFVGRLRLPPDVSADLGDPTAIALESSGGELTLTSDHLSASLTTELARVSMRLPIADNQSSWSLAAAGTTVGKVGRWSSGDGLELRNGSTTVPWTLRWQETLDANWGAATLAFSSASTADVQIGKARFAAKPGSATIATPISAPTLDSLTVQVPALNISGSIAAIAANAEIAAITPRQTRALSDTKRPNPPSDPPWRWTNGNLDVRLADARWHAETGWVTQVAANVKGTLHSSMGTLAPTIRSRGRVQQRDGSLVSDLTWDVANPRLAATTRLRATDDGAGQLDATFSGGWDKNLVGTVLQSSSLGASVVTGDGRGSAQLAWRAQGEPVLRGELELSVGSVRYEDYQAEKLTVRLGIPTALPLRTVKPAISATIASADVGFPINDINVSGTIEHLSDDPVITIEEATGAVLGGGFSLSPVRFVVGSSAPISCTVRLSGLNLGAALALQGEEVNGRGTVDATLPLQWHNGALTVQDGELAARPPGGHLAIPRAAGLGQHTPGLEFATEALADFNFEQLTGKVAFDEQQKMTLALSILGHSPAVKGGRKIRYNINVTENVGELLRTLRLSDQLGQAVEKRIRERLAKPTAK